MAAQLSVDPDISVASTLDKSFYLDEPLYALARERLFVRSWQWIGDLADLAAPGSLSPREMLPGLLDEPLLLVRDAAGVLRCLSNVCTHRGNLLVPAACHAEQIRCPYHSRALRSGRAHELHARLPRGAQLPRPERRSAAGGNRDVWQPRLRIDRAGGAFRGTFRRHALAPRRLADRPARARPGGQPRLRVCAHWALYVENYLEGLHIPFVHPQLAQTLDIENYRYELYRYASLQFAAARDGEAAFDELPVNSPDHGQRIAAYYWWVFPNLMLNVYPWGLSLNLVVPLGVARTRVMFRSFVWDASRQGIGAGGALDRVEREDEAVVQTVQRGLRSRLYARGRYSPSHERGVHHFHRLLCEFIAQAGA